MSTTKTHIVRYDGRGTRHYHIIRDNAVTIIELEAAILIGWKLKAITRQGEADWVGMSADEILEFKRTQNTYVLVTEPREIKAVLTVEEHGA